MPSDKDFDLDILEAKVKEVKDFYKGSGREITDWPNIGEVAFSISFDSAMPKHAPEFLLKNSYIFCFRGRAFGLLYFEWDGDGEVDPDNKSYSLSSYSENALSWEYIAKLIKKQAA